MYTACRSAGECFLASEQMRRDRICGMDALMKSRVLTGHSAKPRSRSLPGLRWTRWGVRIERHRSISRHRCETSLASKGQLEFHLVCRGSSVWRDDGDSVREGLATLREGQRNRMGAESSTADARSELFERAPHDQQIAALNEYLGRQTPPSIATCSTNETYRSTPLRIRT